MNEKGPAKLAGLFFVRATRLREHSKLEANRALAVSMDVYVTRFKTNKFSESSEPIGKLAIRLAGDFLKKK